MKKSLILAAGVLTLGMAMNAFAAEGTTIKWISQGPGEGSQDLPVADREGCRDIGADAYQMAQGRAHA